MRIDLRAAWHRTIRAMVNERIREAERELERARRQWQFALDNFERLNELKKEGDRRYGKAKKRRQQSVSTRARGKQLERRQQRLAEANGAPREERGTRSSAG